MARIETLLLLCHPKGIDPTRQDVTGTYTRPEDRIEWGDVAAALARLKPYQRALVLSKIDPEAVQTTERDDLLGRLVGVIARSKVGLSPTQSHHVGRRAPHPLSYWTETLRIPANDLSRYQRLAATVVSEYSDPKTCRQCNGRGKVQEYVEGRGVMDMACPHCIGQGWVGWSSKRRAATAKVNQNIDAWNFNYAAAYEHALGFCRGEYLAATTLFKQTLFGVEPAKTGTSR